MTEAGEPAQQQNLPLPVRESKERAFKPVDEVCRFNQVKWGGRRVLDRQEVEPIFSLDLTAPEVVEGQVPGNREKPSPEARGRTVRLSMEVDSKEGLLQEILRHGPVRQETEQEGVQSAVMAVVERLEGRDAPVANLGHQPFIWQSITLVHRTPRWALWYRIDQEGRLIFLPSTRHQLSWRHLVIVIFQTTATPGD
jgi:hypothetical protein